MIVSRPNLWEAGAMTATTLPAEQRVILRNITWQMFESLLAAKGEDASTRYAYNHGLLEIMSPSMPHEHTKRLIEKLIDLLVDELDLNIKSVGSMTCKRQDLERGLEPGSGFYIQNEPLVRNRDQLDLIQDPPPDLMLEVDFSSSSLNKLPIYQALAVPEVWRYGDDELIIRVLQQGQSERQPERQPERQYVELGYSPTFANLPLTQLPNFLKQSSQVGEAQMLKRFRVWVKEQVSQFSE